MIEYIQKLLGYGLQHQLRIKIKTSVQSSWKLYDYKENYTNKAKYVVKENYLFSANQQSGKTYLDKLKLEGREKHQLFTQLMGMVEPALLSTGQKTFIYYPAQNPQQYHQIQPQYLPIYQNLKMLKNEFVVNTYLVFQKDKANSTSYQLKQNDIIKLGKKQFKVAVLQTNDIFEKNTRETLTSYQSQDCVYRKKQGSCKICLLGSQENNQLISPCDCQGSCSNVHISCLQKWITSRGSIIKGKNVQSIYYKKLNCEICKARLPQKINIGNRQVFLYQLDQPSDAYLTLQSINENKDEQTEKSIFVICPNKQNQSISVGRGQTCDIRIQHKSISKVHCFITMKNGKFYIKDNSSKFGTLIKITKPIDLRYNNFIQAGRYLFQFQTN